MIPSELRPFYVRLILEVDRKIGFGRGRFCEDVFLPFRGPNYGSRKKIMVVGQAIHEWVGPRNTSAFDEVKLSSGNPVSTTESSSFVLDQILPHYAGEKKSRNGLNLYGKGNFWAWIYNIVPSLLGELPLTEGRAKLGDRRRAELAFTTIAWSNLFKIGALKPTTLPGGELRKVQQNTLEMLSAEIRLLTPEILICTTGTRYAPDLWRAFEKKGTFKRLAPDIEEMVDLPFPGTRVFVTAHPGKWGGVDWNPLIKASFRSI